MRLLPEIGLKCLLTIVQHITRDTSCAQVSGNFDR